MEIAVSENNSELILGLVRTVGTDATTVIVH